MIAGIVPTAATGIVVAFNGLMKNLLSNTFAMDNFTYAVTRYISPVNLGWDLLTSVFNKFIEITFTASPDDVDVARHRRIMNGTAAIYHESSAAIYRLDPTTKPVLTQILGPRTLPYELLSSAEFMAYMCPSLAYLGYAGLRDMGAPSVDQALSMRGTAVAQPTAFYAQVVFDTATSLAFMFASSSRVLANQGGEPPLTPPDDEEEEEEEE